MDTLEICKKIFLLNIMMHTHIFIKDNALVLKFIFEFNTLQTKRKLLGNLKTQMLRSL